LGLVSCDKVPLTSPTGSEITLSVSQTTVPINGTINVIAAVIEAGGTAVHDGTTVTFTGGLGTFAPLEAQTIGGLARTVFRGTTSGTVTIGAFSGAAKAEGIPVQVGAAAAGSVSLQVVPPSVGQNGGSVSVTALVLDSNGNALPGVPVVFSTDFGTLSNANVISDVNGYATTNLITTRQATVTARAGAQASTTSQ
jgi:adhesin/invasin